MTTSKRGRGRPREAFSLSEGEREDLLRYERGRTVSQGLALRARMVLRCAEGKDDKGVARELGIDRGTVGKWRRRFMRYGVEGLSDAPRPNVHRKLEDERVEEVIRLTLHAKPKGSTHWSTRKLAKQAGVSQSSVSRLWRAF